MLHKGHCQQESQIEHMKSIQSIIFNHVSETGVSETPNRTNESRGRQGTGFKNERKHMMYQGDKNECDISQRWFLSFLVVLIPLMFVQVLIELVLISDLMG